MKTIKQENLRFHRAGSDYLGFAWSCHVSGCPELTTGERYEIERPDGTTHIVGMIGRNRFDGVMTCHLVEEDGLLMCGF